MAKRKPRGVDTTSKTDENEISIAKAANLGSKVKLSTGLQVTVKDPPAEELLVTVLPMLEVIQKLDGDITTDVVGIAKLLKDEETLECIRSIAAVMTGKTYEDFVGLTLVDWMKLVKAAKDVIDFKEYQELFTALAQA